MPALPPRLSVHGAPSKFVRRVDCPASTPPPALRSLPEKIPGVASVGHVSVELEEELRVSEEAEAEAELANATPYEIALAQREEKWLSGVAELLHCADELAFGSSTQAPIGQVAASGPPSLGGPGASSRQRKLEEVLQRRLKSLRFLTQQQALLGSQLENRELGIPEERQEVIEMRQRLSNEGEMLNQRMSFLAEAQACLADAEQRCEQEAHAWTLMLQQRQDEIDECSKALEDVELCYGEQAALLVSMRRKLADSEEEANFLLKEKMALDLRRKEVEMRETCLRCMESTWEAIAESWASSHAGALSRSEVQALGAERLASELTRSEPYLRRLHHLVDILVSNSAANAAASLGAYSSHSSNLGSTVEACREDHDEVDGGAELCEESPPLLESKEEVSKGNAASISVVAPATPPVGGADDFSFVETVSQLLPIHVVPRFSTQPISSSTPGTPGLVCRLSPERAIGSRIVEATALGRIGEGVVQLASTPAPAPPRRSTSAPPESPGRMAHTFTKLVNAAAASKMNAANRSSSPTQNSVASGSLLAPRVASSSPQETTRGNLLAEDHFPPMSPLPGFGKLLAAMPSSVALSRGPAMANSRPITMSPLSTSPRRTESPGGWRTTGGGGVSLSAYRNSAYNSLGMDGKSRAAPSPSVRAGHVSASALTASPNNANSSASACRGLSPSPRSGTQPPPIKAATEISNHATATTATNNIPNANTSSPYGHMLPAGSQHATTPRRLPAVVGQSSPAGTSGVLGSSNIQKSFGSLQNIGSGLQGSCYPSQSSIPGNGAGLQVRLVTVSTRRA